MRLETGGGLVRAARCSLGLEKLFLFFLARLATQLFLFFLGAFRARPLGLGNRCPTHLGFISLVGRRHPHHRVGHTVGLALEAIVGRADPQLGLDDAEDVTCGAIPDCLLQPEKGPLGSGHAP
ncbi:MAG TPA: hypothetical protein VGA17_12565 [Nitrospiraceae bacterium]